MIGRTISHYRVTAELGRGGMGVVYRAEDLHLGRPVALKVLPEAVAGDTGALERFRREARAASALNHPHICTIHDIDEHGGQSFIVMELLEGQTLRQRITSKRFDLDRLLEVGIEVASALEAAHARGIVHRDVKAANIFLTEAGGVKVLDFGLAKLTADRQTSPDLPESSVPTAAAPSGPITAPGQTVGTVAYMSPEQVRGEELDGRTDIFSCGVVLYEMATGGLPFPGATAGVVFDGILHKTPNPASRLNPSLPIELDHILDKALEKDRELRYQSARELRADLARLRRDSGSQRSTAGGPPAAMPSRSPKRRGLAAAAAGAGALLLAAAGYLAWSRLGPSARVAPPGAPYTLTRVTFEEGLQAQPTWSPDGRFIAYSSNQSGNFDIWVQPLGGGRAVQVTTDSASDWQPAWSPDGNSLVFRSERDGGGIFLVPALGGRERRLASFGNWPEWSPDGAKILFTVGAPLASAVGVPAEVYLVSRDGGAPERILSDGLAEFSSMGRITWHPDGRRVSFLGLKAEKRAFWTVAIPDGTATPSEVSEEVARGVKEAELSAVVPGWAPDGESLYLEGVSKGVQNLWRVSVDPRTLRWVAGPARLTTGLGIDTDLAVSPNGARLAFVARTEVRRLWSLPFDPEARRATGDGQPITPASVSTEGFDLSADGRRLVFVAARPGKQGMELWSRSLVGASETMLGEAPYYFAPRLSRDGALVAYRVTRRSEPLERRLGWSAAEGGEERTLPEGFINAFDWSSDGERLLTNCPPPAHRATLCTSPRDSSTAAEARPLLADPERLIWQGRFSPDGRWILFTAQSRTKPGVSIVGVVPASGGKWTPITDTTLWADKPRWGPDGRTIYFISNRQGAFFDVWGIGFDPQRGQPKGDPFRVTRYDDPGRTLTATGRSELGVSGNRLVVPLTETSGSVWLLDNIGR
jgi:serine/threonine protein kinase/WD40 repeat protein